MRQLMTKQFSSLKIPIALTNQSHERSIFCMDTLDTVNNKSCLRDPEKPIIAILNQDTIRSNVHCVVSIVHHLMDLGIIAWYPIGSVQVQCIYANTAITTHRQNRHSITTKSEVQNVVQHR